MGSPAVWHGSTPPADQPVDLEPCTSTTHQPPCQPPTHPLNHLTTSQPPNHHSGGTADHPDLLKYSCDLQTNVMPVTPIKIEMHHSNDDQQQRQQKQKGTSSQGGEDLDSLLGGKPLVALAFSDMVVSDFTPLI